MIEHLTHGRAAYFHSRKRRLSQDAIEQLFRTLRTHAPERSRNFFKLVRSPVGDALCSAICFSFERPVSFLDDEAGAIERVFGFLMIV